MNCWKCGHQMQTPNLGKISFRATCDKCLAGLHSCKNCMYYKVGLANDCMIPGTDFVADREANNFCEEFKMLKNAPPPKASPSKKNFDDLFK